MKSIHIQFDPGTGNVTMQNSGFTDAELLVLLKECEMKASVGVLENLKKKASNLVNPHLINPLAR